jgi:beta-phosphoglucomutase-like phosphatase (HAD superfamily)
MKLKIPEGPFEAYLFDCDGTIADTMPLHYKAWSKVLAEEGCSFGEDEFYGYAGMPVAETVRLLNELHGLSMSPEGISQFTLTMAKSRSQWFREVPELP